jgi:hypothetical protein
MSYHHQRQTDVHVAQIYDLIIDQVVEDLMPKLQDEGIDTSVLQNIKQVQLHGNVVSDFWIWIMRV